MSFSLLLFFLSYTVLNIILLSLSLLIQVLSSLIIEAMTYILIIAAIEKVVSTCSRSGRGKEDGTSSSKLNIDRLLLILIFSKLLLKKLINIFNSPPITRLKESNISIPCISTIKNSPLLSSLSSLIICSLKVNMKLLLIRFYFQLF